MARDITDHAESAIRHLYSLSADHNRLQHTVSELHELLYEALQFITRANLDTKRKDLVPRITELLERTSP